MKKYVLIVLSLFMYTCSSDDPASPTDCAGVAGGDAVEDCAGTCNGTAVEDCAGTCNGTAVEDCAGTCNGTAVTDECGECGGDGSSCATSGPSCAALCSEADVDPSALGAGDDNCNLIYLDSTTGNIYYDFSVPNSGVAGFQFETLGGTASGCAGGAAGDAGWSIESNGNDEGGTRFVGFSFQLTIINDGDGDGVQDSTPSQGILCQLVDDNDAPITGLTGLGGVVLSGIALNDLSDDAETEVCAPAK